MNPIFIPNLNPRGLQLTTRAFAPNVYGAFYNSMTVNNGGFVVGDHEVVVIDAFLSSMQVGQLTHEIALITDKPIRYVVNTSGRGDHSFGNCFFDEQCEIVAHHDAVPLLMQLEDEKKLITMALGGDDDVIAGVTLRPPSILVDQHLRLEMGELAVDLYHFGKANAPGDLVAYIEQHRILYSGNVVLGQGLAPLVYDGDIENYCSALEKINSTLVVDWIITGHGQPVKGSAIKASLDYLYLLREIADNTKDESIEQLIAASRPTLLKIFSAFCGSSGNALLQKIHSSNVAKIITMATQK